MMHGGPSEALAIGVPWACSQVVARLAAMARWPSDFNVLEVAAGDSRESHSVSVDGDHRVVVGLMG